jgi:hypothetical protein
MGEVEYLQDDSLFDENVMYSAISPDAASQTQ